MDHQEIAVDIFRKLVYIIYLEIGALQAGTHREIAKKAHLKSAFFQRDKERQATSIFHQVEMETDPAKILAPFEERTGLTIDDIYRAFSEGDWRNKFGGYNFGGPRWAQITQVTIELRNIIEHGNWDRLDDVLFEVKKLKNNRGYLVDQLDQVGNRGSVRNRTKRQKE